MSECANGPWWRCASCLAERRAGTRTERIAEPTVRASRAYDFQIAEEREPSTGEAWILWRGDRCTTIPVQSGLTPPDEQVTEDHVPVYRAGAYAD